MRGGLEQLLHAIAGTTGEVTDPRLDSLQALTGAAHASTDPRVAPPSSNPPQQTGVAGSTNPGLALLQAYQAWQKRTGRKEDPLQALVGQRRRPLGSFGPNAPVALQGEGGNPFRTITHGENAGLTAQTYELGNGETANVYYDRNGRRRVNVY